MQHHLISRALLPVSTGFLAGAAAALLASLPAALAVTAGCDASRDTAVPAGDAGAMPGGKADAMVDAPPAAQLSARLEMPATLPAGGGALPVVVRFSGAAGAPRPGVVAMVSLQASDGMELGAAAEIAVRRDVGTATVRTGPGSGGIDTRKESEDGANPFLPDRGFTVSLDALPDGTPVQSTPARVTIVDKPDWREVSGTLADEDLRWGPDGFIYVTGDVQVPAGSTLTIGAGTRVRLADGANVDVDGDLVVEGTAAAPVLFEPADTAWGGLRHQGEARYEHAMFVGGGADASRAFGHSDSQPVIHAAPGARLTLRHVAIQDAPGKALGAEEATVVVEDSIIARTDTGGELERSEVHIARTHFFDFPDRDAPAPDGEDDDNDALYLLGMMEQDGMPVVSTIEDSVFMHGLDDGIDHSGAVVDVQRSWFEGFANEGIACSEGGWVQLGDSVLTGNGQGLEAGHGAPEVVATHVLIVGNGVGARFGDSYDDEYEGVLRIMDSVIAFNREHAVWNHLLGPGAPKDGAVQVSYSLIDGETRAEDLGEGVLAGTPMLSLDGLLAPNSPGRDMASDGTDMGLRTAQPTLLIE